MSSPTPHRKLTKSLFSSPSHRNSKFLPSLENQDQLAPSFSSLAFHTNASSGQKGISLERKSCLGTPDQSPSAHRRNSSVPIDKSPRESVLFQAIPGVLKKKHILLDPQTFTTFVKPNNLHKGFGKNGGNIRTRPNVLQRGDTVKSKNKEGMTSNFKQNNIIGKMYVNELWSSRYYHRVLNSSVIGQQLEELMKLGFQTTEEKTLEINNLFYSKPNRKDKISEYLLDKYQNEIIITKEDLILEPSFDYSFVASKLEEHAVPNSTTERKESEIPSPLVQQSVLTNNDLETIKNNKNDKCFKAFHLPHLETTSSMLQSKSKKSESFQNSPKNFNIYCKANSMSTQPTPKHIGFKGSKKQWIELSEEDDSKRTFDLSTCNSRSDYFQSHRIGKYTSTIPLKIEKSECEKYSEISKSPMATSKLGLEVPISQANCNPKIAIAEKEKQKTKAALEKIYQNCRDFNEDKELLKYVNNISHPFAGAKVNKRNDRKTTL